MANLQLIPANPLTGTNIRLSSGYSCTIGSSAAADYCFENADLDQIHCRVTCRGNLSFIECLDFEAKVRVNQEHANRASLTHGDEVQIGLLKFKVELQTEVQQYDRIETNDSNESLSELDVPGYELTESASEEPMPQHLSDSDDVFDTVAITDGLEGSSDEFGVYIDNYSFDEEPSHTPKKPGQSGNTEVESASTEESDFGMEEYSTTSAADSKTIESETDKVDVTISSDSTLADVSFTAPNLKKKASRRSSDPKSSDFLKGLVEQWRLVKKTGDSAIELANHLLASSGANIYRIDEDEIVAIENLETVETGDSDLGLVLLLSKLEQKELWAILKKRRWQRRIRFPLGLQRFLELSSSVSKNFFESVEACLVIPENSNEFELISTSDKLPDVG